MTRRDSFEDYFTWAGLTCVGYFIWQCAKWVVAGLPGLVR